MLLNNCIFIAVKQLYSVCWNIKVSQLKTEKKVYLQIILQQYKFKIFKDNCVSQYTETLYTIILSSTLTDLLFQKIFPSSTHYLMLELTLPQAMQIQGLKFIEVSEI